MRWVCTVCGQTPWAETHEWNYNRAWNIYAEWRTERSWTEVTGLEFLPSCFFLLDITLKTKWADLSDLITFFKEHLVASAQTFSTNCWWRDEGEDDRCLVLFTTEWLVNAAWSAKGRSASEIRQARDMHSFNLVNLTEHTPIPCLSYHISVSFIIAMYYEPSCVLHMLRLPRRGVWNYHPPNAKGK